MQAVKKCLVTILAALTTLALALTAHWWAPGILSFANYKHEDIEHLNNLAELVSKLVMWPATAILFILGLWQRKQDANAKPSPPSQIKPRTSPLREISPSQKTQSPEPST